jgi:phage terminase large subunit
MARRNERWYQQVLTVEDTRAISADAVAEEREAGMPEEMIQQEFYCSFDAPLVGSYYGNAMAKLLADGRLCSLPLEPRLEVHTAWDLGVSDSTAIVFYQKHGQEIRIIDYIEGSHRTLADYAQDLNAMRLNWGTDWLPHDAYSKDVKTGKSAVEIINGQGRNAPATRDQIPELGVEDGIRAARVVFPRVYFEKTKAKRLIECLKRYRRHVNSVTNEPGAPLHDEHSHGADAFRYLCVTVDHMANTTGSQPLNYRNRRTA